MDTSLVQLIQYKLTFHFSEQIIYTWDSLLELENGWMPENIKKKKKSVSEFGWFREWTVIETLQKKKKKKKWIHGVPFISDRDESIWNSY